MKIRLTEQYRTRKIVKYRRCIKHIQQGRKKAIENSIRVGMYGIAILGTGVVLSACMQKDHYQQTRSLDRMVGSLQTRLALKKQQLGNPIFIRIFKEESELEVWMQTKTGKFERFGVYSICKYSGQLGPKFYEGDLQAPEGFYAINKNSMKPNSQYHRAFNLGFPNAFDQAHQRTGKHLMVHGDCRSIGCYAMTDRQIEEIYNIADAALLKGQAPIKVHAFPFRMTKQRMDKAKTHRHYDFWRQLQVGYEAFEKTHIPPNMGVVSGRYVLK